MKHDSLVNDNRGITLIIGGTGKTGRRVVERLKAREVPIRVGSRAGSPRFDWEDPNTWKASLRGVRAVYITFFPDLAVPGASEAIRSFTDLAVEQGVERLILLSGRGEEEAQNCESIVIDAGAKWTIVRASWFSQNFSEGFMRDLIIGGRVALPAGSVEEPFVDVDDIADVVVAALTESGHDGMVYEVTGPRLLTFQDAVATIAKASGRQVSYTNLGADEFVSELESQQVPEAYVNLLGYLFNEVLDGRNAYLSDGVKRALGREPTDFADYAAKASAAGVWAA